MRFQRHAKIFRGQLDPAPIAGVFFLLIIFVILGSLLYTPGVLVQLKASDPTTSQTITLTRTGTVLFANNIYKTNQFEQLRADLKNGPSGEALQFKADPGSSTKLRDQIRDMLLIEPPLAEGMLGTDNPVAIVAVNSRGQFFYDNQLFNEEQLRALLKERQVSAGRESKNLTLVLLADRSVTEETIVRVCSLAGNIGIKEVILPTRPGVFSRGSALAP